MRLSLIVAVLLFPVVSQPARSQDYVSHGALKFSPNDWPCWRGPHQDGIAHPDQTPPQNWSKSEHIAWKAPVPGRGHGSPCVYGNHIYLATCDEETKSQSVLCYSRETGDLLWQTEVHPSGAMWKNKFSSGASSTLACDGEKIYINFPNSKALYTTALSRDGQIVWQTKIDDYTIHQGYGSSPALYKSLVIVTADNKSGGAVAGLDRKTGDIIWSHDRPQWPNYSSPIIYHLYGKDQLILTGCELVTSLDPMTGNVLWEREGATQECVTSTVTDGVHVYSSGGYPTDHIAAVKADGSKEISWETGDRVYVPSMVMHEGYIYAMKDAGVALCLKADTGEELWQGRVGGNFSGSAVLVGDLVYVTNQQGETTIFKADPTKYEVVSKNKLGDEQFSTPTICGGKIYMRVAEINDDVREEVLYCIE